ncbi:hypothetical protein BDV59DRAFT_170797 [Aspergillus ambiguus]|uniref:uncharacterized protein n=1 Tax=Aspergillus ambiguus TaxID=176160 RepID=UPI003CCE0C5E
MTRRQAPNPFNLTRLNANAIAKESCHYPSYPTLLARQACRESRQSYLQSSGHIECSIKSQSIRGFHVDNRVRRTGI